MLGRQHLIDREPQEVRDSEVDQRTNNKQHANQDQLCAVGSKVGRQTPQDISDAAAGTLTYLSLVGHRSGSASVENGTGAVRRSCNCEQYISS